MFIGCPKITTVYLGHLIGADLFNQLHLTVEKTFPPPSQGVKIDEKLIAQKPLVYVSLNIVKYNSKSRSALVTSISN